MGKQRQLRTGSAETKTRRARDRQSRRVFRLAGAISQGLPIDCGVSGEPLTIPEDYIEEGEIIFRAARSDLLEFGIEPEALLVVEKRPNGQAATGELVISMADDRVFVGHWWGKNGRRDVMCEFFVFVDEPDLHVIGAINAIVRCSSR
jgi:hypothetical protein